MQLDPRIGDVHSDYGYVLEQQGRKEEALAQYTTRAAFESEIGPGSLQLCDVSGTAGQVERKRPPNFRRLLRIDPKYADAHYDFANLLYGKDDLEGAKQHYLAAIRAAPKRGPCTICLELS